MYLVLKVLVRWHDEELELEGTRNVSRWRDEELEMEGNAGNAN